MKKKVMSRSENMARVKNKNTKPEMVIRKLLFKHGYRYRLHYEQLPGKPDLYISKFKTAVFVNGCFWHVHEKCKKSSLPKTNKEFWEEKLMKNKKRDSENYAALIDQDYKVIIVWECTVKNHLKKCSTKDELYRKLVTAINSNEDYIEIQ